MRLTRQDLISISIKSLAIIACVIGLIFSFSGTDDFMASGKSILYFTIQSNIWILAMMAIFLVAKIYEIQKGRSFIGNGWLTLKYVFTVSITLTFLVFAVLLSPFLSASYLVSPMSITLHILSPVLAILDFFLYDYPLNAKKSTFMLAAIPPLAYFVFAIISSYAGLVFASNGDTVPYFFLDYKKYGWLQVGPSGIGVVYWVMIIFSLVCLIAVLFLKILNARKKAVAKAEWQSKKMAKR